MTQTVFQLPAAVQALVDQGYHFSKWWDLENGLCPKRHLLEAENIKARHDNKSLLCRLCRRDNERKRLGIKNPYKPEVPPPAPEPSNRKSSIVTRMGALRNHGEALQLVCGHQVTYRSPVGVLEPLWCPRCDGWKDQEAAIRFRR